MRRSRVASLWLRGVPVAQIAAVTQTPLGTIRRDLDHIRDDLAEANRRDLEQNRDRSVAVLHAVQEQAWTLFTKIKSEAATNKVGALNVVMNAEERIARLQGTLSPDVAALQQQNMTVNVLAGSGEWQTIRAELLRALMPYPEARVVAAEALAELEAPQNGAGAEGEGEGAGDGDSGS